MKILDNKGQGLTEYMMLLLLIAVASIVTVRGIGYQVKDKLQSAEKTIKEKIDISDLTKEK